MTSARENLTVAEVEAVEGEGNIPSVIVSFIGEIDGNIQF